MNSLVLALSLVSTNAQVRFATSGAGSYSVQCSPDGLHWRVVASNHVRGVEHVTMREVAGEKCAIYRVEWRGVVVGMK